MQLARRYTLSAGAGLLALSLVLGLAAGASWGVLRPAYTGEAADGGVRIDTDASPANVAFTGYAWFAVLTAAVGVVIAAVAWRAVQRGRVRGGVGWMLLTVFAAAAAAAAAYICGGFVVDALHPMPDVTQLQPGDTVTLVPPVEPGVGWVAGPFAAAVVYWCTNLVALQGQPQR